ncbi:hypothetical protein [Phytohabitans houttuyneae]|uniref:hypothetical protein n=1 Tax=Phytohabitans houttuyneae TaxID=1076126 RepID=UPI00156387FC|nr:hypothetical protein [Phytohabitans houttuyneae]
MTAGPGTRLRWAVGGGCAVAAIAVAVWVTGATDLLAGRLRGPTRGVLAWYFAAVVLGTLAQAPLAGRGRARLARGMLATAALLAAGILVTVVAVALDPWVPAPQPPGPDRSDPANWYPTATAFILAGYAVVALSGLSYWDGGRGRPRDGEPAVTSVVDLFVLVSAVPAAIGWATYAGFAMHAAARAGLPWAPTDGQPFLVAGSALAVLQAGTLSTVVWLTRGAQPPALLAAPPALLAVSVVGAQLGHVAHVAVVTPVAVVVLFTAMPLSMFAALRLRARFH